MWRGFGSSLIYRTCFAAMFGGQLSAFEIRCLQAYLAVGFEIFNRLFKRLDGTKWELSDGARNFWSGGLASNLYWGAALRELPDCTCLDPITDKAKLSTT